MVTDTEARIEEAAGKALEAFWGSIVESFPEATSGDFEPMLQGLMYSQAEDWIAHWLDMNTNLLGEVVA
jgi:cytoplasmic iron level regulating protein YaaA (DUF328/UPF0246 family)